MNTVSSKLTRNTRATFVMALGFHYTTSFGTFFMLSAMRLNNFDANFFPALRDTEEENVAPASKGQKKITT